ncbi:MAG: response regulator [Acidaminococcales bacterium]|nr:response regulator [Acidaminococcales bacterium]
MLNECTRDMQKLMAELEVCRSQLARARLVATELERENKLLAAKSGRNPFAAAEEKSLHWLYNKLVLESCPEIIVFFDENLRFVIGSRACINELGHCENTNIGGFALKDVFAPKVAESWIANIERQCAKVLRTRLSCRDSGVIPYIGGTFGYAQTSVSPVMDESGVCRGVLLVINDITELTLTKERAEAAALSKSSFLANMSHEIRTPMSAVKGLAELLLRTGLNHLQKDYARNILKSADMLLSIINDILDFSKIDAGKMDITTTAYKFADFLDDIVVLVNLRAKEKGLLFFVDIDPALPSVLKGDEIRIKQIALNILSNAVKYTKTGWCRFSVKGERFDDKVKMVFQVADTGIGIKEEDLPGIFDAFFRSDLHTTRGIMGTGLGLAIAKRLLLAMDGDISVKSIYGRGTVFTFQLAQEIADPTPLADTGANAGKYALVLDDGLRGAQLNGIIKLLGVKTAYCSDIEDISVFSSERFTHCVYSEELVGGSLSKIQNMFADCEFVAIKDTRFSLRDTENSGETAIYEPFTLTKVNALFNKDRRDAEPADDSFGGNVKFTGAKALLVDDNDINLMIGGEMLRSYGLNVTEAENGQKAVNFCREKKFDIIFMDHMMPTMDGIEAAARIRALGSGLNGDTPIVMFTANVVSGVADEYKALGLQDFVGKPVEMKELYRVLSKWLPPETQHGGASKDKAADAPPQAVFDLLEAMEGFGVYATDAVRELGGDLREYITRLETIASILADVPKQLKALAAAGDLENFSEQIEQVQDLLYQIGARDFAGRAKSLAAAARNGNTAYINMDFNNFLDSLHLLEKKLEVLAPLAKGKSMQTSLLNNSSYIRLCITKVQKALQEKKTYEALANVEILLGVSLDKRLDAHFIQIMKSIETHDYDGGIKLCENLLQNY